MKKAEYKNHVWCWDFTMDETSDGRRLNWFSVVDEFTRECLTLEVERRVTARDIAKLKLGDGQVSTSENLAPDTGPQMVRALGNELDSKQDGRFG